MNILNRPLKDLFFECVRSANRSIKLCSPFVKQQTVEALYNNAKSNVTVDLITNVNLMNFYRRASDLGALSAIISNNGTVYNFQRLHAKFYIFDDSSSIITSANLTPSGLMRNYEYGVFLSQKNYLKAICNDYKSICQDDSVSNIGIKEVETIESLLSKMPSSESIVLPRLEFDKDEVVDAKMDKRLVDNNLALSGWKRVLIDGLNLIEKATFTKEDYLELLPYIQKTYPNNNNIEAKIRQILQQLRDIGLIKFEGNGVYTKLWQ